MKIGETDKKYCQRIEARSLKEVRNYPATTSENPTEKESPETPKGNNSECTQSDLESLPHRDMASRVKSRNNTLRLSNLPSVLDRYKISDRVGAAIASATLLDVGLIHEQDQSKIIDQSKVRRARTKKRMELQSEMPLTPTRGLYFDGRKDSTILLSEDSKRRTTKVEEHIVLIEEPGSKYIGHVTPESSSALNIFNSIKHFFENSSKPLNQLEAVGCDGTVTNTGHKNGIIVRLEHQIMAPVNWFICQLHANELPLRHLIQHIDGNTKGPNALSGVIGKALLDCEKLPLVSFRQISVTLPEVSRESLSADQAYLFDICHLVSTGLCDQGLIKKQPGKLVHSRWLTTANRVLRLCINIKSIK